MSYDDRRLKPKVGLESLTPREREFLDAIRHGMTEPQSAAALGVSVNTVKFHRKNIYSKLGANLRSGLLFSADSGIESQ